MDKFDFSSLNLNIPNSAMQVSAIAEDMERQQRIIQQIGEENARRNAVMEAGAMANIEQKKLLENQIKLLEQQVKEMQERNSLLNDLYETSKAEAIENAKDAKRNRIFGWVSFGVGTLIGIAGIVFGIIF